MIAEQFHVGERARGHKQDAGADANTRGTILYSFVSVVETYKI
jgi:hypothetical protein